MITAHGIRFFQKLEQVVQIFLNGMSTMIILDLVPYCLENKCSDVSAKALLKEFGTDDKKGELAIAILQNALQVDIGSPIQKACYY